MVSKSQVISSNRYINKDTEPEQLKIQALYIAQVLYGYGFTINAIAAMLGNMQRECTLNPGLWEGRKQGNTNGGFGLVQWTPASKLINWCKEKGYDYNDIDAQLARINWEVDNNKQWIPTSSYDYSFEEFKNNTSEDIDDLTKAFLDCYERAGVEALGPRQDYARTWYRLLISTNISFTPRLTEVDINDSTVKRYYTKNTFRKGLNRCLLGNKGDGEPLWKGSVLPNCTGYSWGRAYEIMGKKPRLSTGDPSKWYSYNKDNKIYSYSKRKNKPRLGAIACWDGHVAVVEEIKEVTKNKTKHTIITTSNYGWKYSNFYLKEFDISESFDYIKEDGTKRKFQGYIYLPLNEFDDVDDSNDVLTTSFIDKLVSIAEDEVGKEGDASKSCKYYEQIDRMHSKIDSTCQTLYWGRKNGQDWCAGFVDWCFFRALGAIDENGNNPSNYKDLVQQMKVITNHGPGGASCGYNIGYYKNAGTYFTPGTKVPQAGDEIFLYDGCHTGLVVAVKGNLVYTVEGNTGGGGGMVKKKMYFLTSSSITGYGRPNWKSAPEVDPTLRKPRIESVAQVISEDNKYVIEVEVDCGGIPSITRGVTLNLKWYSDKGETELQTVTGTREHDVNNKKDIKNTIIMIEIDPSKLSFIPEKLYISATQINIDSSYIDKYKNTKTSDIPKKYLVTEGNWVTTSNRFIFELSSVGIPCLNICINGSFKQCIPYIYSSGKWRTVVPVVATKHLSNNGSVQWKRIVNIIGVGTDNTGYYGSSVKGDYWNGTKWL